MWALRRSSPLNHQTLEDYDSVVISNIVLPAGNKHGYPSIKFEIKDSNGDFPRHCYSHLHLRDSGCPFLTDKGQLRVQVEWEESYLLFQATYHKYDDVSRTHNYQMRREITALQTENYSLERQLFSYQKSMSLVQSRGTTYSDDLDPTDLGDGGCVPVDDREDQPHHQHSQGVGAGGGAFYDDGAPLQLQSAVVVGPDGYPLAPHHQHHHQQQQQQQQQHPPHHQLHHHHPLPQPPQQHHHHHP
ncbi:mastermind-like domain-containing protein 1 [Myzus persicae]|uniref:mastermind-like domain-containing protein 1 n=1 Tax=Myzus persicae TaxID=13164 RepID=UPI000B9355E6|nr:mastermind-like domain-containing protein 1 [Myzus persicae]